MTAPAAVRILAYAPSGRLEPGPVVAAGRAGALGVLDGAGLDDLDALILACRGVARYGESPFGLRLAADCLADASLPGLPRSLTTLILTEPAALDWSSALGAVRDLGVTVLAEVTSADAAQAAVNGGAAGLIVAGHEAGGLCGESATLILLQAVLGRCGPEVPVWVRGGIGPRSAAACVAAGAAGVVLDGALLLTRESPLPAAVRSRLGRLDGSEPFVVGPAGQTVRVWAPPGTGSPALASLRAAAEGPGSTWSGVVAERVGWDPGQVWPLGQDAAFAAELAARHVSTGGVIQAVEQAIDAGLRQAHALQPLAEASPLAVSHGTRYPIAQGPMTRVSDTPAFAAAVADAGGLPFLALALMRGPECQRLLNEAATRLAGRPWGVGLLGFIPPELRREQVAAIDAVRPPFALIAGGRPDQARELEAAGIATYLHAPSPALLRQYLHDGARRFVLEGRECGGHVGPRSSLILWEQAVETVLAALDRGIDPGVVHLLFAGGVHDGRSAAAVAALAAPLAGRGVRIGVLMGTAYLFTEEAVATGAIVPGFQDEALRCEHTVLLESGPGHEVRVSPTAFAAQFEAERRRLQAEGQSPEQIREALERLNTGRLRIAAKGVDRAEGSGSPLVPIDPIAQKQRGVYMLGQVATLRDRLTTVQELHRDVAEGSLRRIRRAVGGDTPRVRSNAQPADIAIIGMASVLPGAATARAFWNNTLRGLDAITEVPPDRWDWRAYYDPDPKTPDAITSKWGGFLPEIPFDPLRFGMPPTSVPSIEPLQLILLEVARSALDDAGYRDRAFPRERTAVVLGAGGGAAQLAMGYAVRSYLPLIESAAGTRLDGVREVLPSWTEDSFPGMLLNVAAGRVANRLDLGGANYTVDAACGSSLAAAALAVRELETGAADLVLLGGADTVQNPLTYLAFSKTHAFSPGGRCRPFDAGADGIVISEGVAAVVLKRLADAERDGDRIYAVIKGLGASSDGRAKGLTAPRIEGQIRALERAYERSGVEPATVGYVEAHGTGTAAGDVAEVQALARVFEQAGAAPGSCALGSVKSQIGHTKCAAGLAGLINATLALHHKVLPPTIGVRTPNPKAGLDASPFHLSTAARPWLHDASAGPRRAGVSAFGFGGTNFHAVLEEYDRDPLPPAPPRSEWPAELLSWRANDRAGLIAEIDRVLAALARPQPPTLLDLAAHRAGQPAPPEAALRLAIVAGSPEELRARLEQAWQAIGAGVDTLDDPNGLCFESRPATSPPSVAFLFPGQGSQAPDMLAELAVTFPSVRAGFEVFDAALRSQGLAPVGPRIFAPPAFDEAGRVARREALRSPEVAQTALGSASTALLSLLGELGLEPALAAGHSFGELVALHAAGALSLEGLASLAEARGRFMIRAAAGDDPGAMAAVADGPARVDRLLDGLESVAAVNLNSPRQTVVAGCTASVDQVVERARAQGLRAQRLPVAGAFHTQRLAPVRGPLAALAAERLTAPPRLPVYSNVHAAPYPADPRASADLIGSHVASPVRFGAMIEAMYDAGARVFVEVGPGATLTQFVGEILGDRPHRAIALDRPGHGGLVSLLQGLARLTVAGVPLRLDVLTAGREARPLNSSTLTPEGSTAASGSLWLVNGGRARPAGSPPPTILGASVGPQTASPRLRTGSLPARPNGAASSVSDVPTPAANGEANGHHPQRNHGTNGHSGTNGHGSPRHQQSGQITPLSGRPVASLPADGSTQVVAAFQETMRAFLDTQRAAMLQYLAGRAPVAGSTRQDAHPASGLILAPLPTVLPGRPEPNAAVALTGAAAPSPLPPSPAPEPSAPTAVDPGDVLLRLVQERTGYPTEMLRPELDLEADLGIDSIKRVEILGGLRESLPELDLGGDGRVMDDLTRARTLGAILERLATLGRETPAAVPVSPVPAVDRSGLVTDRDAGVQRFVLEAVPAARPVERARLAPGGLVVITDDGRGIARLVALDLKALGHPVAIVRHGLSDDVGEGINFGSESAVNALAERLRAQAPVAALIHLMPLRSGRLSSSSNARTGAELRGLFLLARALGDDLQQSSRSGGASLIAATGLGGAFASSGPLPPQIEPVQGAVAGLVKTLAHEWPEVRCRVVDLDPNGVVEEMGAHLVHEVLSPDERIEVGYRAGRRWTLRHGVQELDRTRSSGVPVAPGDPVILTGGARGITARIALDLARRWHPTLLLLGSGPAPIEVESPDTVALHTAAELKAALAERLRRAGEPAMPAAIERAYQALRRERELRTNLQALRQTGCTVRYESADVRDADAVVRVLGGWTREFGPAAGLVHGAGLIVDKLLRDKTLDAFDRVLATKLDGAEHVLRNLDLERLKFAAFFASVAGRFGNKGQSDYAAANEALCKLAIDLDRRIAGRVVAMLWGPWAEIGMVSDLQAHLARRGLGLIPPDDGAVRLGDELQFGSKGTVEVMIAGDLTPLERIERPPLVEAGR